MRCPGVSLRDRGRSPASYNRPVIPPAAHPAWYLPACVAGTVLLLLLLIIRVRLHAALALMIAALGLGIASGMPLAQVPASFTAGVGGLMGRIAIILGLGAVLGRLLERSGAAAALSNFLVEIFGPHRLPWAMLALGILVGLPVFFEVGLVLLMPIVLAAARRSGQPPIRVAIPLLAGLSIMHGTVPPHPAAMLAATAFHADVGRTIFFGLIVGIPAATLAGPLLGWVMAGARAESPAPTAPGTSAASEVAGPDSVPSANSAGALLAMIAILLPVLLIFLGSWADSLSPAGSVLNRGLRFAGYPDIALLITVLVALFTLGRHIRAAAGHERESLRRLTAESFSPIAGAIVILSAAGGLSGVLRDSGAAQATVNLALGAHVPALVLAWLLAAVVRVSMGSATVAMAVASGVLAPFAATTGLRPELLVMATGCGSLMLSHVNDSGFWLVQSLFGISTKETLATWSIVETVLSISGLIVTLLLSGFVR